ncbi:MAG: lactonase family protein [Thermogutta sp.]|uniref:lactonase family protein n=1 Tax=Thermogutta sp. TaxID=1962930 RepID=UPI0019C67628|nr:lactonase family protein [Thermogutta sp.]MBC7352631.1 lactonase family protein [Thermogutta sp.]
MKIGLAQITLENAAFPVRFGLSGEVDMSRLVVTFLTGLVLSLSAGAGWPVLGDEYWVFYGTYTRGTSKGIYVSRFNAEEGTLSEPVLAAEAQNPSFLALHPQKPLLYAVGELWEMSGRRTGSVSAFAVDVRSGRLSLINQQPSGGSGPCHVSVDATGRFVLVANYGGGSVAVLPVSPDGGLGPTVCLIKQEGKSVHPTRQTSPHAHQIGFNPTGKLVVVPDLGLDQVLLFDWDGTRGQLTPHKPPFVQVPPGSGPRHFAFHPSGKVLYVLNELTTTVSIFACDDGGPSRLLQSVSALPADFTGQNTAAEIAVHPTGRFVYTSNRGHDSVAVFAVSDGGKRLELKINVSTQGKTPRFIGVDPTGRYLLAANQDTNNVVIFKIDSETGIPTPTGKQVSVGAPVCLVFYPVTD